MKPPYNLTPPILSLAMEIAELKGKVSALQLERPTILLRRVNKIKTIQSSLAIEGNTLGVDQVTALFDSKRVLGTMQDIMEAENAIAAYKQISAFKSTSVNDMLTVHGILMKKLIRDGGQFRHGSVGVVAGSEVAHVAPPAGNVRYLMNDLFDYLADEEELPLIKSCVFHYELAFIHPFSDGNGRMARFWQTKILMEYDPVFEYVPVEVLIKKRQQAYYTAIQDSNKMGTSNPFILYLLQIIKDTLQDLLDQPYRPVHPIDRLEESREYYRTLSFSRNDYMKVFRDISTATASRDLRLGVERGILKREGDKRLSRYEFV